MAARFDLVTLDAVDAERLVSFWSDALGLDIVEREDGTRWTVLGDAAGGTRRIGIQRIDGLAVQPPVWDGAAKPRLHLDLVCSTGEFAAETDRLVALGATRLRPDRVESYGSIATLADPEGNVFDLCAYGS
jgi:catechol 2,3-dioxygenase-like lactoylglutathione lyase family enzyme